MNPSESAHRENMLSAASAAVSAARRHDLQLSEINAKLDILIAARAPSTELTQLVKAARECLLHEYKSDAHNSDGEWVQTEHREHFLKLRRALVPFKEVE